METAWLVTPTPTDPLGGTRLVTNTAKPVLFSDSYQPFGQDNGTPGSFPTRETYRFTGKPYSSRSGWYYYDIPYDLQVGLGYCC